MIIALLQIYGPLGIQPYGVSIVVALGIFLYALRNDTKLNALIDRTTLTDAIILGIVSAVIGGRIFFVLQHYTDFKNWYDIFALWEGGFSILGSIIGILMSGPLFFRYHDLPFLPIADRISLYGPLLQGFSRIGCFFAGCCYGIPSTLPWAIKDGNNFLVHPTPLYSCINLIIIFCILFIVQKKITKFGHLFVLYLLLVSIERFFVDFLRGDRQFYNSVYLSFFSITQWIALCLIIIALYLYWRFKRSSPLIA